MSDLKKGAKFESPGGLGFVVKSVTKDAVTVDVDRVYRDKDDKMVIRVNERVMPPAEFVRFAKAYSPCG